MIHSGEVTQESLDSTQYTTTSILDYKAVYGEDFVSPGGRKMALELIRKLGLATDAVVLDVGCGLGGSAFVMARDFGFIVNGIDLSKNMLEMANTKLLAHRLGHRVTLEHGDCLEMNRPGHYDAIYSRDVFLHISDKRRLFSVLRSSLRPTGKLLFTDYCCGEKPWSKEFSEYVENRGYCLHTIPAYAEFISAARFDQVKYHDLTDRFIKILQTDLTNIARLKIKQSARDKLTQSWLGKIARSQSGDHRWGLFTAVNPP